MENLLELIFGFLFYYGSTLIPIAYLSATGFRGQRRRRLLTGMLIHAAASLGVAIFVLWCRRAGYSEWYWGWVFNIPVNLIAGIGYLSLLCSRT